MFSGMFIVPNMFSKCKININPYSTDVTYVTFHPYMVPRLFLATRSCPNACNCIWRQAQADERG